MTGPPAGLEQMAQEAESLAQRLGFLCDAALTLLAQRNMEGLLELLAQQEQLRSRIEPLTAQLLSARDALPRPDALEAPLLRIAHSLAGAQSAGRLLQEQLEAALTQLGERIAVAHQRSEAVGSYGGIDVRASTGFTRTG